MSPRPSVPADDLYARLELPSDATPEAIEIAWRSLLRRHHPDVAGPSGLDEAKRINVAHDWLSVPELRARYDHERGLRTSPTRRAPATRSDRPTPAARRRPDPADTIAAFLEHVTRLTPDELDRLAVADPAPIAFGATIRRFLPPELQAALSSVEREIDRRMPLAAAGTPPARDAIRAHAAELVLGPFLDELLSEPFRARTRERLSRGWEAAVDQPRYGPNGQAIRALIERLRELGPRAPQALARGERAALGEPPWPPGTSPDDEEGLRVSAVLAARDAAAAVSTDGLAPAAAGRARRAAAWLAHVLALRHGFSPRTFEALVAPWRPALVPADPPGPRVRRPARG